MACDPDFANVVLLLHMDGASGATVFPDDSSYNHSMTAHGAAQVQIVDPKFGTGNEISVGNTADYLSTPDAAELGFGTGNWTIECWIQYVTAAPSGKIAQKQFFTSLYAYDFLLVGGQVRINGADTAGTTMYSLSSGFSISAGWHHIAAVRNGSDFLLFVDGVLVDSAIGAYSGPLGTNAGPLQINLANSGSEIMMDEFRMSALARYTANFVPAGPFGVACPADVVVPDVVGLLQAAAEADIIAASFIVGTETIAPDPSPAGTVLSQDPIGGSMAPFGSAVDLVLSSGNQLIKVYGRFVGSKKVFKAIEATSIGDIKPRLWPPRTNGTVYS